jgi:hypothetical protein
MKRFVRSTGKAATTAISCFLLACGNEPDHSARVLVAGPSYTGRCDEYSICDGASLSWTTASGIDVELSAAMLMVLFGMARGESELPTWADQVVPGQDAVDDFATDGGVVELPGERGFCTVSLGSRLCEPCHLRDEACGACTVPPGYVAAWLDGKFVQWSLDVDKDVGPFTCEVLPDEHRWFVLEIRPRQWFEGVTTEMLEPYQQGDTLARGTPLYDVVVDRITRAETFRTLPED